MGQGSRARLREEVLHGVEGELLRDAAHVEAEVARIRRRLGPLRVALLRLLLRLLPASLLLRLGRLLLAASEHRVPRALHGVVLLAVQARLLQVALLRRLETSPVSRHRRRIRARHHLRARAGTATGSWARRVALCWQLG